jgi:small acid-soluble spore protein I (minor)
MEKSIESLDLRNAIMYKLNGSTPDELKETIVDAIESKEERTLPGLGVLFEILWQNSTPETQDQMLNTMAENISRDAI